MIAEMDVFDRTEFIVQERGREEKHWYDCVSFDTLEESYMFLEGHDMNCYRVIMRHVVEVVM